MKWFLDFDRNWLNNYFQDMGLIILGVGVLLFILFSPILIPLCELGEYIHSKFNKDIG